MNDTTQLQSLAPGLINAACPLDGVATAGQPTAAHLKSLAAAGYRTVLDLRAPEEPRDFDEPAVAAQAGLEYVNLPVSSPDIDDTVFEQVRALLRDPERRPLLFHCAGASRVGALLIPYLVLDEGRTPDEAVETAIQVGLRSGELAQAAFRYVQSQQPAG